MTRTSGLGANDSRCCAGCCSAAMAMPLAFARQTRWLGWRCVVQLSREPSLVRTQLVMHLVVALTLGGLFLDVKSDIAGFQNKAGAISFTLYFFSIGGLSSAQTVTREWPLLWAEYHQGLYSAITYAITRLVLELFLLRVLPAIAYGGVFYSMMGLRRETGPFVRFLFGSALASADSALLCTAVSAFAPRHTGAAMLVSTVLMLGCLLLSGLNLNLDALPAGARWLPDVSFGKHAFEIMLSSELDGQMVLVDVPGAPPVRIRANVIIEKMGLSTTRYAEAFVALIGIGLVLMSVTAVIVALQMRPSFKAMCRPAAGSVSHTPRRQTPSFREASLRAMYASFERGSSFFRTVTNKRNKRTKFPAMGKTSGGTEKVSVSTLGERSQQPPPPGYDGVEGI